VDICQLSVSKEQLHGSQRLNRMTYTILETVKIFLIGLILHLKCFTAYLNKMLLKTSAMVEVATRTGMKKASAADYDNGKDKDLHWLICNG
jgi:hypothetical protein